MDTLNLLLTNRFSSSQQANAVALGHPSGETDRPAAGSYAMKPKTATRHTYANVLKQLKVAYDTDLAMKLWASGNHAARQSRKWRKMKGDVRCGMGWIIVANLATQPDRQAEEEGISDDELGDSLEKIEAGIHTASNDTRSNMNGALIAIGCWPSMSKQALDAAGQCRRHC